MWKFLVPFVAFLALCVFFAMGLNPNRDIHALPSPLIGKQAPPFNLSDLQNPEKTVSSDAYKGQVYVLNVWATWCVPCREEHDEMLAIAARKTVPLVGLNWKDQRNRAQAFLAQLGNPYAAVAFDGEGRAAIDWGVYGAPETYLIDANGTVLFKYISPITEEVWQKEFMPRIKAAKGGA